MIKNTSFHLNNFIKWAAWCECPWDGIFFLWVSQWVPYLTNYAGDDIWFSTNKFLKNFIRDNWIVNDGVYWLWVQSTDAMFYNITTCNQVFVASENAERFMINTNWCVLPTWWVYAINVSWCNATYSRILDDLDCSISPVTWLTSNSYTCWALNISWNAVVWATQYRVSYWSTNTTTTSTSLSIPYTSSATVVYSVVAIWVISESTPVTISVPMEPCAITWLTTNWYIHWDLTLSWDSSAATYYRVTYWSTTTDVTIPTITIPYTAWWNVTYQVRSCNISWCSIATSITVPMMQSTVSWISSWSYSCWDLILTWTPTVWATQYWVSYWMTNTYVSSPTITIPYTNPGSVTYNIRAWNSNWYNTWSTISVTMNSCWISNLSSSWYTCWDLNINWDDTFWATSYKVSYLTSEVTVTSSNVTIPFWPTTWNVTYTVRAYNWATLLATATITVNMQQCVTYLWNTYSSDGTMRLTTENNPTNFFWNTAILDDWTQLGEIVWFAWSFNPTWIKQNPYTKKIHYWTSSWVYVWNVWEKSVTYVWSGIEPVYTNTWITYWWTFNGTTQEVNIYNWSDTSLWTYNFSGGYMPSLQSWHRKVHCSPDWSKIVIVGENQITIRNNVWSNLYTVSPYDMITNEWYYKANLSARDSTTNSLIVVMDRLWNNETELDSVFKVNIWSFSNFNVWWYTKQLECYNGFVYSINAETVEPSWFSQSFQRYNEPLSEISTTNNPTTLWKPRKYSSLTRTNITTWSITNRFTSWLYHTILETSLWRNIYAIYPASLNVSTCADWYLSVAVATWYNEWWSTFTWPTWWAILKVNNDLTYWSERTIISLSHNYYYYWSTTSDQYKNWWQTSNYWYRFRN